MNTQKRSAENKANILRAINRFGWLRTKDIAVLIWSKWKRYDSTAQFEVSGAIPPSQSQLRMAQRTLKTMHLEGLLLVADAPDGSRMYGLSAKGAQILGFKGVDAASGKDQVRPPSLGYFRHRCISNEIAIAAITAGYRVSTEREIAKGAWRWGKEGLYGKLPDVLVKARDHFYWIEVERSRRNRTDYVKMLRWLTELRTHKRLGKSIIEEPGVTLTVTFVCSAAFSRKLTTDLHGQGFTEGEINSLVQFKIDLYRFEVIHFL